jgi:phage terminase small subunit
MPRRSAASLSIVSPSGAPPRLQVPAELSGKAAQTFISIVAASRAGHFLPQDEGLLVEYCRAVALADEAANELRINGAVIIGVRGPQISPWTLVQEKAQRAMAALAVRLKLGPQMRGLAVSARAERPLSYHERQALEQGDDAS